jgi:hypothetical protein
MRGPLGRPAQVTASHHMEMHMENNLPASVVDICHQAIATISDLVLARQAIGDIWDGAHPDSIIGLDVQEGRHMPLRHDEEVDRGAGMDILNGQQHVIFVDFNSWLSVVDDLAKRTFSHQTIQCVWSPLTAGLGITLRWLTQLRHRIAQLFLRVLVAYLAHDLERLLIMGHSALGVPHLHRQAAKVT